MNHGKSLVVALTRFYGAVMLFYGIYYATYLRPYYERYVTVYENPAAHGAAAAAFWTQILQSVLRLLVGLILIAKAGRVIDSLCHAEDSEPGLRSLIVALVKLNGFILLFYSALGVIDMVGYFCSFSHLDLRVIFRGGPQILRPCLNFLAGLLVVAGAARIIDWLEPHQPAPQPAEA